MQKKSKHIFLFLALVSLLAALLSYFYFERGALSASEEKYLSSIKERVKYELGWSNKELTDIAAALGKTPWQCFFAVRGPMLLKAILSAIALGFAVSAAQYLVTVLVGAGRLSTITIEAVALSSGGNRRVIGVYTLVQMLLPALAFAIAALVPAYLWRNRRGLSGH